MSEISRYRRELRANPGSLRFVQLAEALRREGFQQEAEAVVLGGLLRHAGLKSARLVLSRVLADTGRVPEALQVLTELYPEDHENLSLVRLYLDLLLREGRQAEARELLEGAEQIGLPSDELDDYRGRARAPHPPAAQPGDPFATARIGDRLARAGLTAGAIRVWETLAADHPEAAVRLAMLRTSRRPERPHLGASARAWLIDLQRALPHEE